MFSLSQRVGIAVSGGADSVCLLHFLHKLAPSWNLHLSVIHIDHGIRGAASEADADFVSSLSGKFALPFHFRRVDVPAIDDNMEQAARRVRQAFYQELISSDTVDRIATGHTKSDQAETVLYRVLRGAGLPGLSGVRPITREGIVRPLLDCARDEVRAWLEERGLEWREDETNRDVSYARNRIRHDLLPQLRREFNPRLDDTLANMAEMARDEEDYWAGQLEPIRASGALYVLTIRRLRVHPAEARRVVRRAIEAVKGDLRQIGFEHVEAVLDMARSHQGHGRMQIPGVDVFRSFDWIRLAPAGYDNMRERDFAFPIWPPARVEMDGDGGSIDFQVIESERGSAFQTSYDSLVEELDWQRITSIPAPAGASLGVLELRNWRPGDHYRRREQPHEQKIKLLFQEARIPLWERRRWPVLTANGIIVWSRGFGPAADFIANGNTRTILRISDANSRGS